MYRAIKNHWEKKSSFENKSWFYFKLTWIFQEVLDIKNFREKKNNTTLLFNGNKSKIDLMIM